MAELLHVKVSEIARHVLGEEHQQMLKVMNHLGAVCKNQGKYDKGVATLRETVEKSIRSHRREHPTVGNSRHCARPGASRTE